MAVNINFLFLSFVLGWWMLNLDGASHSGRKGTQSPQCPARTLGARYTCETRHSSGNALSGWAHYDLTGTDQRLAHWKDRDLDNTFAEEARNWLKLGKACGGHLSDKVMSSSTHRLYETLSLFPPPPFFEIRRHLSLRSDFINIRFQIRRVLVGDVRFQFKRRHRMPVLLGSHVWSETRRLRHPLKSDVWDVWVRKDRWQPGKHWRRFAGRLLWAKKFTMFVGCHASLNYQDPKIKSP